MNYEEDKATGGGWWVCSPTALVPAISSVTFSNLPHTTDQVTIGRLRKRIKKIQTQRDKLASQLQHYREVLNNNPHLEAGYRRDMDYRKLEQERAGLQVRVFEQSQLINECLKKIKLLEKTKNE